MTEALAAAAIGVSVVALVVSLAALIAHRSLKARYDLDQSADRPGKVPLSSSEARSIEPDGPGPELDTVAARMGEADQAQADADSWPPAASAVAWKEDAVPGFPEDEQAGEPVEQTRPCECGCGTPVIAPRRFVSGHNLRKK